MAWECTVRRSALTTDQRIWFDFQSKYCIESYKYLHVEDMHSAIMDPDQFGRRSTYAVLATKYATSRLIPLAASACIFSFDVGIALA